SGKADRRVFHVHLRGRRILLQRMRRSGAGQAFRAAGATEKVGTGLSLLLARSAAGGNPRNQTAELQFHLCPVQERPGRNGAVVWANLSDPSRGVALLQHLWHSPGPLESLHRGGRDLRFPPDESETASG